MCRFPTKKFRVQVYRQSGIFQIPVIGMVKFFLLAISSQMGLNYQADPFKGESTNLSHFLLRSTRWVCYFRKPRGKFQLLATVSANELELLHASFERTLTASSGDQNPAGDRPKQMNERVSIRTSSEQDS